VAALIIVGFVGYLQVHGYSLSSAESVEVISPPGYHNGVLEVSFTSEMPAGMYGGVCKVNWQVIFRV